MKQFIFIIIILFCVLASLMAQAPVTTIVQNQDSMFLWANLTMNDVSSLSEYQRRARYELGQSDDTTQLNSITEAYPNLQYLYFSDWSFGGTGIGQGIVNHPSLKYLYSYRSSITALPEVRPQSNVQYLLFDQSPNLQTVLPASWQNFKQLRRLYFRRNSWTAIQVTEVVTQLDLLLQNGMSGQYSGAVYIYLNSGGSDANAAPSIMPTGWTNQGSYWQHTGYNARIYTN